MKVKTYEILIVMAVLFVLAFCFGGKEPNTNRPVRMRFKEPNEPPDDKNALPFMPPEIPDDLFKIDILRHIPTWPDYIQLEKDLVLRYDFPEPNNPLEIHFPSDYRIISKGTKIYFKED